MAYQTGTATDYNALLTALTNFCVANGWAWDAAHAVLSKGALYFNLTTNSNAELRIQGGTGVDGTGAITGTPARWANIRNTYRTTVMFPVTYHLHASSSPDSIVLMVNHSTVYWQWLLFGQGNNLGCPGNAAYFGATNGAYTSGCRLSPPGPIVGSPIYTPMMLPFTMDADDTPGINSSSNNMNSFIYSNLDGEEWAGGGLNAANSVPRAWPAVNNNISRLPNAWNNEVVLLPVRPVKARGAGLYSNLAELPHIRFTRNTYLADGDIIAIGTDQWKVYPGYKKDAAAPNGVSESSASGWSSGTYAMAVRYEP